MSPHSLPKVRGNAGCLLKYQGKILVVRNFQTNKWDIPSGKPQGKELADETALRETYEETGLNVLPIRLLEDFSNYGFECNFYVYECQLSKLTKANPLTEIHPKDTHEIKEAKFLEVEELTEENVRFPEVLARIKELFRKLE